MVVIISHFDSKIGPRIFLTYPEIEITEDIKGVKTAMDYKDSEGFVMVRDNIMSLNYLIAIPSPHARGRQETVLLSYILTETEPNEKFYKSHILRAVKNIKSVPDIYKAFIEGDNERYIKILREIIRDLDIELRMRDITTIGYCVDNTVFFDGYMVVPRDNEPDREIYVSEPSGEDEITKRRVSSYLMVYKKEHDGSFSLKGYPILTNNVYKMEIFTDQINIGMVAKITNAFKEMLGGRIVYTSGICQATAVCSFELYFEYDGDKDNVKNMRESLINSIESNTDMYPMIMYARVRTERSPFEFKKAVI